LKKLLIILYLSNFIFSNTLSAASKEITLLILDKSSSSKYEINFSESYDFRDLSFSFISCENIQFDKYIDQIALLKINQANDNFIGWFFKTTDELNLYSNKIYEVSLIKCSN
tara:strand:- start:241 stop:576 length:336 start_codon:yes stop_codon:yes gene_type:complete